MEVQAAESIVDLIGNTPLVRLRSVTRGLKARVYAKLEFLNPGGSVKDRIGLAMIMDAEEKGFLKPGGTIVEPTSGNTGMGLALAAIQRGYKIVFTVPDKMSTDKIDLLRAVGAKVLVTPSVAPPGHRENYVEVAKRVTKKTPGAFMPNQYTNPANPEAHYLTTGPEIWRQTRGTIDALVAGVGTGGTITGTGRFLKEQKPSVRVIGVDPEGSILAATHGGRRSKARPYRVEGIGEDFIPATLDMAIIDDFVTVSDQAAMLMTRRLAREEGILAGTSSGAAVQGAIEATRSLGLAKTVVVILPDTGRSYLNKVYNDGWMIEQGFTRAKGKTVRAGKVLRWKASSRGGPDRVKPSDEVTKAAELMVRTGTSHLMVVRDGIQIGSLSQSAILRSLAGDRRQNAESAMDQPLPNVGPSAKISPSGSILRAGALSVLEGKRLLGLITSADLIGYLAEG